ncbi:MAG: DUF2752 domain-containing protein [Planctomycetaceae bacterium]|nr:DUF2752 domain-containing protein [Planctomycetaceae bacterium]
MSETSITPAPLLDSPPEFVIPGAPLGRGSRVLLCAWTLFLIAGFGLATRLEPDPRGYGTHQSLGLPPCSFQILFGLKCPSCGSTTSFAHFVRGQWISSIRSNPSAFVLALFCAAMAPWSAYSAWIGRTWRLEEPAKAIVWMLSGIVTLALVQWLVRIALE